MQFLASNCSAYVTFSNINISRVPFFFFHPHFIRHTVGVIKIHSHKSHRQRDVWPKNNIAALPSGQTKWLPCTPTANHLWKCGERKKIVSAGIIHADCRVERYDGDFNSHNLSSLRWLFAKNYGTCSSSFDSKLWHSCYLRVISQYHTRYRVIFAAE